MTSTLLKSRMKDQIKQVGGRPKHKGGAPQKKIKRASGIRVRLTATERFLIESKARQAGIRISDWFRAAALKAKVVTRITAEDRRALHLLAGMANNLNQLTKLAHTSGIMSIVIKCGNLLIEIDQTLKYLNSDDGKDT
ncbi:MAG: Mobilization protein [Mucilaginibacter sp.]|nr:Mobilization protein [Mucilaginibacter sp.]